MILLTLSDFLATRPLLTDNQRARLLGMTAIGAKTEARWLQIAADLEPRPAPGRVGLLSEFAPVLGLRASAVQAISARFGTSERAFREWQALGSQYLADPQVWDCHDEDASGDPVGIPEPEPLTLDGEGFVEIHNDFAQLTPLLRNTAPDGQPEVRELRPELLTGFRDAAEGEVPRKVGANVVWEPGGGLPAGEGFAERHNGTEQMTLMLSERNGAPALTPAQMVTDVRSLIARDPLIEDTAFPAVTGTTTFYMKNDSPLDMYFTGAGFDFFEVPNGDRFSPEGLNAPASVTFKRADGTVIATSPLTYPGGGDAMYRYTSLILPVPEEGSTADGSAQRVAPGEEVTVVVDAPGYVLRRPAAPTPATEQQRTTYTNPATGTLLYNNAYVKFYSNRATQEYAGTQWIEVSSVLHAPRILLPGSLPLPAQTVTVPERTAPGAGPVPPGTEPVAFWIENTSGAPLRVMDVNILGAPPEGTILRMTAPRSVPKLLGGNFVVNKGRPDVVLAAGERLHIEVRVLDQAAAAQGGVSTWFEGGVPQLAAVSTAGLMTLYSSADKQWISGMLDGGLVVQVQPSTVEPVRELLPGRNTGFRNAAEGTIPHRVGEAVVWKAPAPPSPPSYVLETALASRTDEGAVARVFLPFSSPNGNYNSPDTLYLYADDGLTNVGAGSTLIVRFTPTEEIEVGTVRLGIYDATLSHKSSAQGFAGTRALIVRDSDNLVVFDSLNLLVSSQNSGGQSAYRVATFGAGDTTGTRTYLDMTGSSVARATLSPGAAYRLVAFCSNRAGQATVPMYNPAELQFAGLSGVSAFERAATSPADWTAPPLEGEAYGGGLLPLFELGVMLDSPLMLTAVGASVGVIDPASPLPYFSHPLGRFIFPDGPDGSRLDAFGNAAVSNHQSGSTVGTATDAVMGHQRWPFLSDTVGLPLLRAADPAAVGTPAGVPEYLVFLLAPGALTSYSGLSLDTAMADALRAIPNARLFLDLFDITACPVDNTNFSDGTPHVVADLWWASHYLGRADVTVANLPTSGPVKIEAGARWLRSGRRYALIVSLGTASGFTVTPRALPDVSLTPAKTIPLTGPPTFEHTLRCAVITARVPNANAPLFELPRVLSFNHEVVAGNAITLLLGGGKRDVLGELAPDAYPVVESVGELLPGGTALLDDGAAAPRMIRRRADGTLYYGPAWSTTP